MTGQIERIQKAQPGQFLVHRDGTVHMLVSRKENGTGWWITNILIADARHITVANSSIFDEDFAAGDWRLLDTDALALLFGATTKCGRREYVGDGVFYTCKRPAGHDGGHDYGRGIGRGAPRL